MSDADRAAEGPTGTGSRLSLDERAELERRGAGASPPPAGRGGPGRRPHVGWRAPVAIILIVVGLPAGPALRAGRLDR